jgi:hypothetical protein
MELDLFDLAQEVMEFESNGVYNPKLKIGDWISRSISSSLPLQTLHLAQHHGIVCDFDKNGDPLVSQLNVVYHFPHICIGIKTSKMVDFLHGDRIFRLYQSPITTNITKQQIEDRINLLSKKYHDTYNLFTRNCEHYIMEILTGNPISYQILMLSNIKNNISAYKDCSLQHVRTIISSSVYPKFDRCKWKKI